MKEKIAVVVLVLISILLIATYIPIKKAVHVSENEDEVPYRKSIFRWYIKGEKSDFGILETSDALDRPRWKYSGSNYVGEDDSYNGIPLYYTVEENDPLQRLNSSFNPQKVKNCFAIKYYNRRGDVPADLKDGYFETSIVITDWVPVYPIRRSGWLASKLLPKGYLTIWDFIAVPTGRFC